MKPISSSLTVIARGIWFRRQDHVRSLVAGDTDDRVTRDSLHAKGVHRKGLRFALTHRPVVHVEARDVLHPSAGGLEVGDRREHDDQDEAGADDGSHDNRIIECDVPRLIRRRRQGRDGAWRVRG